MVSVIALPLPALDQLTQITEKLLAAEEKKLKVLKAEIQASRRHSDQGEDAAKVSLICDNNMQWVRNVRVSSTSTNSVFGQ